MELTSGTFLTLFIAIKYISIRDLTLYGGLKVFFGYMPTRNDKSLTCDTSNEQSNGTTMVQCGSTVVQWTGTMEPTVQWNPTLPLIQIHTYV